MPDSYTHKNLSEVENSAEKHGMGEHMEARFASDEVDAKETGFSHTRVKPGKRQPFAHRHEDAEEVYVVVAGSGRVKLDDDVVELKHLDAIRVSPGVMRCFEGGDEGIELLAFGRRNKEDSGEVVPGWWSD
jgi:mannose-6-phosphate isomerase-like protein (cupin superfamily)